MNVAKKDIVAVLTVAVMLIGARSAEAQGGLTVARDLYAAANYDEALTTLNALAAKGDAITDSGTVGLYRALCLYALGRNAEGDRAVEVLVAQNPLYHPPTDELSPRMRTTVSETRRRMLPALFQQKYAEAKTAYEHQDYASAVEGFTRVIEGVADPDVAGHSALADLGTLASGFRDLAQKALTPPPAPTTAVVLPPPVAVASAPRVYSTTDPQVVAPVPIRQMIPTYTRTVTQRKTAVVELIIDASGAVESAAMLSPLDPVYDRAVVAAAKSWRYEPAKFEGKAVKYQKRVQITLVPTPAR